MAKCLRLLLLLCLSASSFLWAGKEFTAGPGESVAPDQLIVRLKPGANIAAVVAQVAPQAVASLVSSRHNTHLLRLPAGLQDSISKALAAHASVEYVEPNHIRTVNLAAPNDTSYSSQWALTNIQALQAWNYIPDQYLTAATAGTGRVKVAVLDTGADCTHPDFKNAGGTSTDSAQGGQFLFSASHAPIPTSISSPACPWQDDHGHGTHTAGTVAAATANGSGVASIGYALQLIIYKVLDSTGSGPDSTIATAIESAADAGAAVVSMSLGGTGYSQSLQDAINYAWQRNTLVVAAAGNTSSNALFYPGAGNHALGVAATDSNNLRASFSTYGNWVKISAPGVNILSTVPTYSNSFGTLNYGNLSGTSMATPHVAGTAGLLALANPNLSAAAIAVRLQQSAQSPNTGWDPYIGYGVLSAGGALGGTIRAGGLGSLAGQVVNSSNVPVTGAIVSANGQSFTTASDGLFRIPNLAPGTYTLTASASGFPPVNMQAAVLTGADTMLTVSMGVSTGEFTGQVTHNGNPVTGAVVEAVAGGLIVGTALTDSTGSYALYLPAGTYSLTASAPGAVNTTVSAPALAAGAVVSVNISLSTEGNISGVVKDSSGAFVANARIDVGNGTFSTGTYSDANGNFATLALPAGSYTINASATGYSPITQTGAVVNDASTPVTLVFAVPSPAISGVSAGSVTNSGAVISWTTNQPADTQVNYGTTASYGSSTPLDSTLVTPHSASLSGLAAGTTYHYQVLSKNSQGLLTTSGDFTFTTSGVSSVQQLLQLHLDASEVSGVSNGSVVTPAVGPAGFTGTVVVKGSGSVNFAPAQIGSGAYFLSCCTNANDAYYKFTGAAVGNIFNAAKGQVTFYLDSRYSFAQRQTSAAAPRYAFDVRDANGHQFFFLTQVSSGNLIFEYKAGTTTQFYYVPKGTEDTLFGLGVVVKINLTWDSGTGKLILSLNDRVVQTGAYTAPSLSWTSASVFDVGAYEYLTYGGYNTSDDIIDEFTVAAPTPATPPTISMTAPAAGTVSATVSVSANATSPAGMASVQFQLDGANLGALQSGPGPSYSLSWDTTTAANGPHTITAIATDTAGSTATASGVAVTVSNVSPPPTISGVSYSGLTASNAIINWATDQPSDSQVNYGTTGLYGSSSSVNSTLTTAHSVTLSGLSASTTYHYQVLSRNSQGTLSTSSDYTFTTAPPPTGPQPSLLLHLDASEVSGTGNGAVVTPSIAPAGFTGNVVVKGSGTVNYAPAQSGNGIYFLSCCTSSNNAYYKFTGSTVGNIFNAANNQVTFYLNSRYSFAQRQTSAASPRYAFDVRDANGHQFFFLTQVSSGYLEFSYKTGGSTQFYFVPKGTEDALFGSGVLLKVNIAWNSTTGKVILSLNDSVVQTSAYTAPSVNWTSASTFDLGAYEYLTYGGYNSSDDIVDEFSVGP